MVAFHVSLRASEGIGLEFSFANVTPIMQNQMGNNADNERTICIIRSLARVRTSTS